jgi:hypothetical protein
MPSLSIVRGGASAIPFAVSHAVTASTELPSTTGKSSAIPTATAAEPAEADALAKRLIHPLEKNLIAL